MDITAAHHFDRPIDEVWPMFLDPEAHVAKYRHMGHGDVRVLASEPGDGALSITIERQVDAEVPAVARKFVTPTNTVTTTDRWEQDGDGNRVGRTTLTVKGLPVSSTAVATLTPDTDGAGCVYEIVLTFSLKIPLVGNKIAAAFKPQLAAEIETDFRACEAWLADH